MKVHVIEDEADLQKAASFYLTNDDFEVSKSISGGTAVDDVLSIKPDVVLLDLMLPEKSGMDVLKELRAKEVTVPVVIMTNLPLENLNKTELDALGVKDVLLKAHTDFSELSDIVFAAYREVVERNQDHTSSN